MKKFITLIKITLLSLIIFTLSSCDIFESFLFNIPLKFQFESSGSSLSDDGSACLEDDETFKDVQDKINSITFVEGYIAVLEVSPENIQGDVVIKGYGGTSSAGQLLFQQTLNDVRPADYGPETPFKLTLDEAQIQVVNVYLAENGSRCFYGTMEVTDIQNGNPSNAIVLRLDLLFKVDADLN